MRDHYDKYPHSHSAWGEFEKPPTNGFEDQDERAWPKVSGARDNRALGKLAVILLIVAIVLIVLATIRW